MILLSSVSIDDRADRHRHGGHPGGRDPSLREWIRSVRNDTRARSARNERDHRSSYGGAIRRRLRGKSDGQNGPALRHLRLPTLPVLPKAAQR